MEFRSPPLRDEAQDVTALLEALAPEHRQSALETARRLVEGARARAEERPYLDAFLQEFGLSNQEGIALMCLAEALLRIPDDDTADRLIAEKLAAGDWSAHAGRSDSLFVNASTWGLMLTGIDDGRRRWLSAQPHTTGERTDRASGPAPGHDHHRRRVRGGPQYRGGLAALGARTRSGTRLLRSVGRRRAD